MKIRACHSGGKPYFVVTADSDVDGALLATFLQPMYEARGTKELRIGGFCIPGSGNPPKLGDFNFGWVEMGSPEERVAQLRRHLDDERERTRKARAELEELREKLRALVGDDS